MISAECEPEKWLNMIENTSLRPESVAPYLIDEATGKVHTVPVTKLGPMRASAVKAKANRNYLVLFGNGEKRIHRGSLVTVVIGDFRAEHLEIM